MSIQILARKAKKRLVLSASKWPSNGGFLTEKDAKKFADAISKVTKIKVDPWDIIEYSDPALSKSEMVGDKKKLKNALQKLLGKDYRSHVNDDDEFSAACEKLGLKLKSELFVKF